ncbi:hypothetical protein GCM10009127_14800 [Alteraurantiacibacter aestuarii]|uniref:Short chain dehydrogenase-like proteobacteria domain-containing protein n=1 Tax=Alteraurantiacibacter aestuarii TaxID=650004 RepID=A0A844ZKA2_9SPHN|nr:hypothetical protein [Alteraurantiacibacter aestuarii]MXO87933.1 hypothetical protein [Alteraurantiacibacter aestuarii]
MVEFDLRAVQWPASPLDSAALFHRDLAPQVRDLFARQGMWADIAVDDGEELAAVVIFPDADHTHSQWRIAAIQDLAREAAPGRVNAIAGGDDAAVAQAVDYLTGAPGVTGQILQVDAIAAQVD